MHLVLFGMQNRILRPYLAAINRIFIRQALEDRNPPSLKPIGGTWSYFGMQNRTLRPCLAAIGRILISVMPCTSPPPKKKTKTR
jgi:hypothetical protein